MPDTPRPDEARRLAKKVLLIGWDAADWKVITPLLDAGKMPALESLIDRGVMGNLATLDPPLSPMLWTSIATGKTADQHGILGFVQPTEDGLGIRPVLGTSRKCKAVWNILNQEGLRSNVVGWWPSHPAEPLNGAMVSNFYHRSAQPVFEPWPLPPGSVHPPELADTLAALRMHPGEITMAHVAPFVNDLASLEPSEQEYVQALVRNLADASSVQSAATYLIEHTEWDFMAVYFDAIDHFSHSYMQFHPPRMPQVPPRMYELFKDVVAGAYRFHDMMLDRMLDLVDDDTTVLLISDHGFHSDHLRPKALPKEPAAPAHEHRDFGIFVMAGPGVQEDERVYGASLLDITPTLLTLYGLPVGQDMVGTPLVGVFDEEVSVTFIPSWEQVDGDDGGHAKDRPTDIWAEQAAMDQLVELGYIEDPTSADAEHLEKMRREAQFYLARAHLSMDRFAEARPILEALYEDAPHEHRYAFRLAEVYQAVGELPRARTVVDATIARFKEQHPEQTRIHGLNFLDGSLLLAEGRVDEALNALHRAEAADPHRPTLHRRLGQAYLQAKKPEDAERAFLKALTIDPNNPGAHRGLAQTYLQQRRFEEAADSALRAIGLRYFFPAAHYLLGEALVALGTYARAAQAFEVALVQAPTLDRAHFWLAQLYASHLDNPAKASYHQELADTPFSTPTRTS